MKMKGCQRERRRTGPARVKDKKRGTKDAGTKEKNCEEKKRTTKAVKVRFKDQRPYLLMADETVVPESRERRKLSRALLPFQILVVLNVQDYALRRRRTG